MERSRWDCSIAARLLQDYRGKTITLSSPLIVARKGLYTALAKWARGKGFAQLRVDGKLLPTAKWPRLDRFIEHNIELPVATLKVNVAAEAALREALDAALQHGKGVVHVEMESVDGASGRRASGRRKTARRKTGRGEIASGRFLHQARVSQLRHRFSRARSAAVLL